MTKHTHESRAFPALSDEEHRVLDARSFAKPLRGRAATYVVCAIRNKPVLLKPEERTRQLWLSRLLGHYGYPASRIAVEYPITFGRDSSKRADIVVFDADRTTVPYIIIEVKQPSLRDGKEQLRSYAHATGAPLASVEQRHSRRGLASQKPLIISFPFTICLAPTKRSKTLSTSHGRFTTSSPRNKNASAKAPELGHCAI